jgi:N-acetylneuraminate synthase
VGAYIIADIGINANGDLGIVKKLIQAAVFAGCDAVKFQMRTVSKVYTKEFLDSPRKSPWGTTQRQQKEGLELSIPQYEQVADWCVDYGIDWSASCWDLESFLTLHDFFHPPWHKIASPMLTNLSFINEVARKRTLTHISTGMSTKEDIDRAADLFDKHNCPFTLLHCVSIYPCPTEKLNLEKIKLLQQDYPGVPIGYSGHEVGLGPSIVAVALGAQIIERHITLDRTMYGSDQAASVEPHGFKRLVDGIREIEAARKSVNNGYTVQQEELANAKKLRYWE